MAEDGNVNSTLGNGADNQPSVGVISQYIKDLSVENPNAPKSYQWQGQPQIDVQFNIASNAMGEDVHEVELKITVSAKVEQGTTFAVELAYAGLIGMRNLPEEHKHPFLFAEAPRILFPFARRVLADAVRDAGYPPLMLEPIDFNGLYLQQKAAADARDGAGGGAAPLGNA